MKPFEIYTPSVEEVRSGELGRRMRQFNYQFVGEYGEVQPIWVSAKSSGGDLIGGLRGFVFLDWFRIDLLFVDDSVRQIGVGSSLLESAETKARDIGAKCAALETFEWQARDFYLKQGYEEYARLDDYIKGFGLIHMKKTLAAPSL
ncbi:GNAT family N-acetyltransferase [Ottowia thiooxydans]|uniref:GNAT family N-acetyltransferase n=1 Tax=Ottowia thiooxydans TaxID=219182 RepID=UPI00041F83CB|nr:GNAT family N-acetyltransferase [Ottowia thiooxydans]